MIEKHPLRVLLWEPTIRCNLECLHCSNNCTISDIGKSKELTTQEITYELNEIAKHYNSKEILFIITGGEPLIRDDIFQIGYYAHRLGYKWGLTTNGLLLNKDRVQKLKKAHIDMIAVSLDGLEREHNILRNSNNSFKMTLKGIKNLLDNGFVDKLEILCCVSKINIDYLEPFIKFLDSLGIKRVRFMPIFSQGRASKNKNLLLDGQNLYNLLTFIKNYREINRNRYKIKISLSDDGYYGSEFEMRVRDNLHYCGAGIEWGAILYDGAVVGSTNISRKYIEGNIRDNSFISIWENRFYNYRKGREKLFEPYCKECQDWILCRGGGFHFLDENRDYNELCNYKKLKRAMYEK
jgi:radical SAM protein with 4Fe4S-binding SPASM domain